jgi:uncharacterized protein (TIGR02217 family)
MATWSDTCPSPQFVFDSGIQYKTVVTPFESGKEQRRKKWTAGKRRFTLRFNALSAADVNAILTFFIARCGSYESFTFTNPVDSSSYTVRFESDTIAQQFVTSAAGGLETTLVEVK